MFLEQSWGLDMVASASTVNMAEGVSAFDLFAVLAADSCLRGHLLEDRPQKVASVRSAMAPERLTD